MCKAAMTREMIDIPKCGSPRCPGPSCTQAKCSQIREQAIDEAVRRAIPIINTRRKRSRYNDKWPLKSAADLLTKRADNAYAQSFKPTVNGQYTKIIRAEYRRIAAN